MNKVHIMIGKRWKFILINDEVFNTLCSKEIIRFTNCVWSFRPYTKNYTPISVNIPSNREFTLEDFTIKGPNNENIPVINTC